MLRGRGRMIILTLRSGSAGGRLSRRGCARYRLNEPQQMVDLVVRNGCYDSTAERAGRCRGLFRYRDLLDLKVHVRIPALEDGAQFPVERPHTRL